MSHRFSKDSLVHNTKTNEDAKVTALYVQHGIDMYQVSVPKDSFGWEMGAEEAHWEEGDLELSENEALK